MTLARVVHNQIQDQGGELTPLPDAPGGLEAWARKAQLAFDVAKALALTPFVPESLVVKKVVNGKSVIDVEATTGNVLGVLLAGDELALQPMASLRSIDIIQGVPALRAIAQRAIVQAAGHELVVEQSSSTACVVKGRRKGSTEWQRSRWDMDRAKALGLANKENWRKQPTAQLVARASAECARLVASDALLGMPYSVEELSDGIDSVAGTQPEAEKPTGQRTARRRSAAAQTESAPAAAPAATDQSGDNDPPEPDFDSEASSPAPQSSEKSGAANDAPPSSEAVPDPQPDLVTPAQLKKLHAALGDNELSKREEGLAYISGEIGRDITTSKELTKAECSHVIDALDRLSTRNSLPAEPAFDDVPIPDEPPEE